jgi:hypothetical protein
MLNHIEMNIGLSAHPTLIMSGYDGEDDLKNTDGFILSKPSRSSHFTLSSTSLLLAMPSTIYLNCNPGYQSFDITNTLGFYPANTKGADWDSYFLSLLRVQFPLLMASSGLANRLREIHFKDAAEPENSR